MATKNNTGTGSHEELLRLRKELKKAQQAKVDEVKKLRKKTMKTRRGKWVIELENIELPEKETIDPERRSD